MNVRSAEPRAAFEVDAGPGRPTVVWLDNGVLRIGAVPDLGGRLLSAAYAGTETLWRNARLLDDGLHPVDGHVPRPVSGSLGDWVNYGGDKTWPAPQGWSGPTEWAGPPDPVLDSGPYTWSSEQQTDGAVSLVMTSADDPRTGLRLRREVTLSPGRSDYTVRLRATNTSDAPVRWALWNVTQRRAGRPGVGGVDVGVGLDGTVAAGRDVVPVIEGTGVPEHVAVSPDLVHVPHQDVVGKLGFPTATGWLAHTVDGLTCTAHFTPDPEAAYPDGGSRAEIWLEHPLPAPLGGLGDLDPPDRIVEVEVLGPLVALAPGADTDLTIRFDHSREGDS